MISSKPYDRAQRVADEIYHIIAMTCYNSISDPRLKGVSITNVVMTKDLKIARVYYHLDSKEKKRMDNVQNGLESAVGFMKKAMSAEITLRFMPEIEFFYDETYDLEEKIDGLLKWEKESPNNV